MVEGGPRVAAGLVAADLVDEAVLLHGAMTIGREGIDPLEGVALEALTGRMQLVEAEQLGPDRLVRYERSQSPLVPA
jgi:diaminohydroxyphosphoribosylaminopyrimidine deaminase/5-amino-6-(5-phosphoribosylamino)uracil reductase